MHSSEVRANLLYYMLEEDTWFLGKYSQLLVLFNC